MRETEYELRGRVEQWIADEEAPDLERTILALLDKNYDMLRDLCHHLGIERGDDYA